jgi:hypothetical protein
LHLILSDRKIRIRFEESSHSKREEEVDYSKEEEEEEVGSLK